jgi:uncharacterized protein YjbI with pentapeptide repeats
MANPEHLQILQQGVEVWNAWLGQHTDIMPDLSGADLSAVDLSGATLINANLTRADLTRANLRGHLRQDKLYIKENEGILHEVKISPAAYRRDVPCSCP